jgi:Fe-S oxidoreductase
MRFGAVEPDKLGANIPDRERDLTAALLDLGAREAAEIRARFPDLMRRVGGYNIDALMPPDGQGREINLSHLLVGSEGTLAYSNRIELKLSPLPRHKVLGVVHFPTFYQAMDNTRHIVALGPTAVELVDRTMIELGLQNEVFRETMLQFVRGEPDALLLVEFAGDDPEANHRNLKRLVELMDDLGFPGAVVEAIEPPFQQAIWEVRKQALNIMMSMKGDGKPVSFVEDCAVRLEDLAEYTDRLTQVFEKHGTQGTWYAHASVGCLHVRPVLNLKQEKDVKAMRAIAEEAFAMVREYKGSHSGEHGDGLVRSEFHEPMFGPRMVRSFEEVKTLVDPDWRMNPGKIVRPSKMDDRSLFRFKPGYAVKRVDTGLDWSDWAASASGGFGGAIEMCNNNGACRKLDAGVMCPSYRVTRNERDLVRGRANTLRLAVSGQLGPDALTGDAMQETLKLCVSCKGCKRECPTGVDMARLKIEVLHQRGKAHGVPLREKLVAYLPRYAPVVRRLAGLANLRNRSALLRRLGEAWLGFAAERPLPEWRGDAFYPQDTAVGPEDGNPVALFADTFNRHFEPENVRAAVRVLTAAGYRVHLPRALEQPGRPLCCGRTFLAAGLVEDARAEASRTLAALLPLVRQGMPVVGLEPSCLLTLRDEFLALLPGEEARELAGKALLLEEFLAGEVEAGRFAPKLKPLGRTALLHGHCHQKAFGAVKPVERVLGLIPGLEVETVESSCCGMAGSFGYQAETLDTSRAMGELSLLPAMRAAPEDAVLVADGTSCRHQIADGAGRQARHVALILEEALDA